MNNYIQNQDTLLKKCNHRKFYVKENITVSSKFELYINKTYKCKKCNKMFEMLAIKGNIPDKNKILKMLFCNPGSPYYDNSPKKSSTKTW